MAREAHPQRIAALKAIIEHTAKLGPIEGARAAKKLFPDVGVPTWKSWVKLSRAPAVAEPAPAAAFTPASASLAVLPSFSERLARIDAEIDMLVAYAHRTVDGVAKLTNPVMLLSATRLRTTAAGIAVKAQEAAMDNDRRKARYESMVAALNDAIRLEEPGVARRIAARLRAAEEAQNAIDAQAGL